MAGSPRSSSKRHVAPKQTISLIAYHGTVCVSFNSNVLNGFFTFIVDKVLPGYGNESALDFLSCYGYAL